MTINPEHQVDIHDMVRDLTRSTVHRERYSTSDVGASRYHSTTVPALVDQLLAASPAGSGEESGSGAAKSKPAARIECVDTIMLIDHEASAWLRRLGEDDPGDTLVVVARKRAALGPVCGQCVHQSCVAVRRGELVERRAIPGSGTIACIRLLHGLHASAKQCDRRRSPRDGKGWCCTAHHIEEDVRRWWRQARIISGWDSPAWRPDNTCLVCEQRRSLRVNLSISSAFCVECRSTWGPTEIGLLAEHIREENAEDSAAS